MDTAEHDRVGIGFGQRRIGQLEGVTDEVGILYDLVALVEVAEDDESVAELCLGGEDAFVQIFLARALVCRRQLPRPHYRFGDDVVLGGTWTVAGHGIELPGPLGQFGITTRCRCGNYAIIDGGCHRCSWRV